MTENFKVTFSIYFSIIGFLNSEWNLVDLKLCVLSYGLLFILGLNIGLRGFLKLSANLGDPILGVGDKLVNEFF